MLQKNQQDITMFRLREKKKKRLRNFSRLREPRETEQLNAGRLDPELDPELV